VYEGLEARGARLEEGLREAAGGRGCVQRVGAMATLFWQPGPVRSLEDAQRSDVEHYGVCFRHTLDRGILLAPSQFECMFVSLAHGDEEIDRTVEAVAEFAGSLPG
jgi:glutamate-1-semialdehyde 2,1-aminomutase